ncbi:MAG: hypothetical protein AABZ15_11500 [Nitrospirota bacterium]
MKGERKRHHVIGLLLCAVLVATPVAALAVEQVPPGASEGFSSNIRALLYGNAQYPAHSSQNPENAFARLYRYSGTVELRPDLFFDSPVVSVVFKPRFTSSSQWWEDGMAKGERDNLTRAYVNEWRVQAKPLSSLFVSFGKEKLLWGPSFLASPSNVLFKDTEKANPKTEVEGRYLARVMYLPNAAVTITGLSETQRDDAPDPVNDKPVRAVKADWVGSNAALSLVGHFKRDDRFRFGSYGQWTASDAVLLYYDGIVTRGTDVLYPVSDPANPLGGTFTERYNGSDRLFATAVVGGGYSFLSGSTLNLEFLYNGQGYGDADAAEYYRLRDRAGDHYFDGGLLSALSARTLGQTMNTGMQFLRRYYLMGQYQVREIGNALDIAVRYTHGLEERTGQASTILEWKLSDRVQFFNINMVGIDRGRKTEFSAILARSFMAGIEVHF